MPQQHTEPTKDDVRSFWNARPCGTQFTDLTWGSREFFKDVEQTRREIQPFMDQIIQFGHHAGRRVLEIGCGLGTDLMQFARAGANVTGIDLTPASVELAQRLFAMNNIEADIRVGDAENLPFPDGAFDVVYSFGVLHHTPNTQKAIDEAYRVLAPQGVAIIMLYHTNSLHVRIGSALYRLYRLFSHTGRGQAGADWVRIYDGSDNPLGRSYTRSEVRSMFSKFENIEFSICDPIRRRFPSWVNRLNQRYFASHWGFYLVTRAFRPS